MVRFVALVCFAMLGVAFVEATQPVVVQRVRQPLFGRHAVVVQPVQQVQVQKVRVQPVKVQQVVQQQVEYVQPVVQQVRVQQVHVQPVVQQVRVQKVQAQHSCSSFFE